MGVVQRIPSSDRSCGAVAHRTRAQPTPSHLSSFSHPCNEDINKQYREKMASPTLDHAPFTIQNLPYGIISTSSEPSPRCAVAIGEHAIDLPKYANKSLNVLQTGQDLTFEQIFSEPVLNTYASLSWSVKSRLPINKASLSDEEQADQASSPKPASKRLGRWQSSKGGAGVAEGYQDSLAVQNPRIH